MHIIGKKRSLSQSAGWQFVTKLIRSNAPLESNFRFAYVTKINSWQPQLNNIPVDEVQDLLKRSKSANTKIFFKNLEKEIRREF